MKLKFYFLIILFSFITARSQQGTIIAVVKNENNYRISDVTIINISTNQVFTGNDRGERIYNFSKKR